MRTVAGALNLLELDALLNRVSYKPGWELEITVTDFEGPQLMVTTTQENAYRPGEFLPLGIQTYIPPVCSEEAFLRWLAWRLERIEIHEMREFLRLDGQVVFDPHKDDPA